ncbi:MAG: hypothetical protein HYX79_07350 [Chloroflexi bacterium]|nr:hypothetical protein [Chloroflexota bacterium]
MRKTRSFVKKVSIVLLSIMIVLSLYPLKANAAFLTTSAITIDSTFTDWGTPGSPTTGIATVQDASNTGTWDASVSANSNEDLDYFWSGMSTLNGGTDPASPSNPLQSVYYRIDSLGTKAYNPQQNYAVQLNLGSAPAGYADHFMLINVYKTATPAVRIKLYVYNSYPEIHAFTTGSITAKVGNVADSTTGYVLDTNATGAYGTNSSGKDTVEVKIPIGWYSSTYGGNVAADGTGSNAVISTVFSITGSITAVGTVKDTINGLSGGIYFMSTSTDDGSSTVATDAITKLAFATSAQSITAGEASSVMTVQTQDAISQPENVSSNTTIDLSSSSGTGTFSTTAGGTYTSTLSVTITSGTSSANFYYKDTTAGTPTITAAENPSAGWTDATQQETIVAASISQIVFTTDVQSITAGEASSVMTIQTQDTYGNASNVSGDTQIDLSSSSGNGTFSTASGGTYTATLSITISNGTSSASFYYKDTTAGTPTITAAENPGAGWTDATQQETITAGGTPAITNTPNSYAFGIVSPGSTNSTGLTYFTLTNTGSVAVNITIGGTDMTGGTTWTLSDTSTAGADECGLKAGLEGGSYNIVIKKNTPFNTFTSGLGAGNTQRWGLQLLAPTSFSDGGTKTGTVTLTATQA